MPELGTSPGSRPGKPAKSFAPKQHFKTQISAVCTSPEAPAARPAPQTRHTPNDIFVCDEESQFYSQCLEKLLVKNSSSTQTVIEFGSGDGTPVIGCLVNSQFSGVVHGFELNSKAANVATSRVADLHLLQRYKIHNSCFFKGMSDIPASCLIANPPYIPAPDNDILMPALHGGTDGANLTRDLMTLGFDSAILLLSSYANPVETLDHARANGYQVTDFMITPMPFGYYSSEPKVKNWIWKMRDEGKAFCSDNWYLLAGVLFQKKQPTLPVKHSGGSDGHVAFSNGVSNGNGHVGGGDGHPGGANAHLSNGNGHVSMGNGHMHKANGAPDGHVNDGHLHGVLGDCSGLRHRYAVGFDGGVNSAEDQTDELIKVMTALR